MPGRPGCRRSVRPRRPAGGSTDGQQDDIAREAMASHQTRRLSGRVSATSTARANGASSLIVTVADQVRGRAIGADRHRRSLTELLIPRQRRRTSWTAVRNASTMRWRPTTVLCAANATAPSVSPRSCMRYARIWLDSAHVSTHSATPSAIPRSNRALSPMAGRGRRFTTPPPSTSMLSRDALPGRSVAGNRWIGWPSSTACCARGRQKSGWPRLQAYGCVQ